MAWICPKCGRTFAHPKQWHSCVTVAPQSLIDKMTPASKAAYGKLLRVVKTIGPVTVSPSKSAIFIKVPTTYLAVKPLRDGLKLEFYLDRVAAGPPVVKTVQLSANRIVHEVIVYKAADINAELKKLLRESYALIAH